MLNSTKEEILDYFHSVAEEGRVCRNLLSRRDYNDDGTVTVCHCLQGALFNENIYGRKYIDDQIFNILDVINDGFNEKDLKIYFKKFDSRLSDMISFTEHEWKLVIRDFNNLCHRDYIKSLFKFNNYDHERHILENKRLKIYNNAGVLAPWRSLIQIYWADYTDIFYKIGYNLLTAIDYRIYDREEKIVILNMSGSHKDL